MKMNNKVRLHRRQSTGFKLNSRVEARNGKQTAENDCYEEFFGLQDSIQKETSTKVFKFISEQLDLQKYRKSILFCTKEMSLTRGVEFDDLQAITNIKKLNHAKDVNGHIRAIHTLLPQCGIYIGCAETYSERNTRISNIYGKKLGLVVQFVDFVVNRAFARMKFTRGIYRFLTGGTLHLLSKSELFGRLFYNGFALIDVISCGGCIFFSAVKVKEPSTNPPPSGELLFKMSRVGKDGRLFSVYKFRTMHPYSEYVQKYIIKINGYNEVGKPNDDWRITSWGKWMRKLWLDEIPQLINVLKGEMKIVGVRPLSKVRFHEFPDDVKALRIRHKPGCIPPYVALNMPDEQGNIAAEVIYMNERETKRCFLVDLRYFRKAVYNILSNQIRSS